MSPAALLWACIRVYEARSPTQNQPTLTPALKMKEFQILLLAVAMGRPWLVGKCRETLFCITGQLQALLLSVMRSALWVVSLKRYFIAFRINTCLKNILHCSYQNRFAVRAVYSEVSHTFIYFNLCRIPSQYCVSPSEDLNEGTDTET
jgi:hypothetical protein